MCRSVLALLSGNGASCICRLSVQTHLRGEGLQGGSCACGDHCPDDTVLALNFFKLFFYCCSSTVVSICSPPLPSTPAIPTSHPLSCPPLVLSMCPLYTFLKPSPFILDLTRRRRGQEREEASTSLLLLHFYLLQKVLLGIKIFHAPSQ